jgi:hypothetical protein
MSVGGEKWGIYFWLLLIVVLMRVVGWDGEREEEMG